MTKILAFSGSLRRDSFNSKLVRVAGGGASEAGAEVEYLDLRELELPLFDQDLEDEYKSRGSLPEGVTRLQEAMLSCGGLLIASPEYNSSFTPALKNAIDWASRRRNEAGKLACFEGKVAGLVAASPGRLGGIRGLNDLRSVLGSIGVIVLPGQYALSGAHEAFDEQGELKDGQARGAARGVGAALARATALHAG